MVLVWQKFLEFYNAKVIKNQAQHFGNKLSKEALWTQSFPCLFPLPYGILKISGPDSKVFLQGQLSCDLRTISPSHSSFGAYCNTKGRILAFFRLFKIGNVYYLRLPYELLNSITSELKRYAQFSKLTIQDVSTKKISIGLSNDNLKSLLSKYFNQIPTENNTVVNNNQLTLIKTIGRTLRFELYGSLHKIQTIWSELQSNFYLCGYPAWELNDIRSLIPEVYLSTQACLLPHYINLPQLNAISLNKGCFRGQEIIARMAYRSKIKYRLKRYYTKSSYKILLPGTKIYIHSEKGSQIISIIRSTVNEKDQLEILLQIPLSLEKENQLISTNSSNFIIFYII